LEVGSSHRAAKSYETPRTKRRGIEKEQEAMKVSELREMSPEQLELTLHETAKNLFRLRMQAQTERLSTPSELRSHRKTIARIKTIQQERQAAAGQTAGASA